MGSETDRWWSKEDEGRRPQEERKVKEGSAKQRAGWKGTGKMQLKDGMKRGLGDGRKRGEMKE